MFRILQLSDLHFGPMCHWPRNDPETVAKTCIDELKLALQLAREDLPPSFDAVLLSGDFCWGPPVNQQESRDIGFKTSMHFIRQLLGTKLVLSEDALIFLPGNHDIVWSERDNNGRPRYAMRSAAEGKYQSFVRQCLPAQAVSALGHFHLQSHLGHLHHFTTGDRDYLIIALNSCRIENQDHAGLGYVGYDQLYGLLKQAEEFYNMRRCRVIVALHHHVLPIETIRLRRMAGTESSRRVSFMTDAWELLTHCLEMGADVVLHGHMHTPHVYRYELPDVEAPSSRGGGKLVISAAGSFALGQASRNIERTHQFQVIEFSDLLVRFYSFETELRPEEAERAPWTMKKQIFLLDDAGRLKRTAAVLDEEKLRRALFEKRLFEDVIELDAWSRNDSLARALIQNRVRRRKLKALVEANFNASFAFAEKELATPAFLDLFQRRLTSDAPKKLNRYVEEKMNEWPG